MNSSALKKIKSVQSNLEKELLRMEDVRDLLSSKISHLTDRPRPRGDVARMEKELIEIMFAHGHLAAALANLKTI